MTRLAGIYSRADLYEIVYHSRGKDYQAEAQSLASVIRERNPTADSLLDVACGTGSHLLHLVDKFEVLAGLDLAADMLAVAGRRLERAAFYQADMRDFQLPRRYDAITCLFSSIGYLPDPEAIAAALDSIARHLNPGGVVVVEPWWFPEQALDRHIVADVADVNGRTIARMSHSLRDGRQHRLQVHYLLADPDHGIEHMTDTHELHLFTQAEYEAAFAAAGCSVEYLEVAGFRAGLFVGCKEGRDDR